MPVISRDKLLEQLRDCKKHTTAEVLGWAQTIYDHRGPPPYKPDPTPKTYQSGENAQLYAEAYNKVEAELLTDFMVYWMPQIKQREEP